MSECNNYPYLVTKNPLKSTHNFYSKHEKFQHNSNVVTASNKDLLVW